MDIAEAVQSRERLLGEGSIFEKLRRDPNVEFDQHIFHACLVYDDHGAKVLERTHRAYLDVGLRLGLPMIALTNTWRASAENIARSRFHDRPVNQDDATFMRRVRDGYGKSAERIFIGGLIGPRGDAYDPREALSAEDAEAFHRAQLDALREGGVDFLKAATLPAVSEAVGIARAMAAVGLPYALSFVIRSDGSVLDGTPLAEAIRAIDQTQPNPPIGYFVNCVHPSVFRDAMAILTQSDPNAAQRVVGFFANTSDLDPEDLDGIEDLQTEDPDRLAHLMIEIHDRFGVPILGGCCGTDVEHMDRLAHAIDRRI